MGQGVSSPIRENLDSLHNQLMQHAGADFDIATATTLSYNQFVSYITDLNKICAKYKDKDGCVLVFAVKKGTDATVFWKATVRIACVKLNTVTNKVETHRLLNIRQFLQVFRRISYECTDGAIGIPSSKPRFENDGAAASSPNGESLVPPTIAASIILGESHAFPLGETSEAEGVKVVHSTNLEECVICLERKPNVILPCCHSYCLPCIEQWWEYCENPFDEMCLARNLLDSTNIVDKSCPVCRESLSSTEDTWVISEVPDTSEVSEEIRKSLISYATSNEENQTTQHNVSLWDKL